MYYLTNILTTGWSDENECGSGMLWSQLNTRRRRNTGVTALDGGSAMQNRRRESLFLEHRRWTSSHCWRKVTRQVRGNNNNNNKNECHSNIIVDKLRLTAPGHPMNPETQTLSPKYPIVKTKKFFARVLHQMWRSPGSFPPPNVGLNVKD